MALAEVTLTEMAKRKVLDRATGRTPAILGLHLAAPSSAAVSVRLSQQNSERWAVDPATAIVVRTEFIVEAVPNPPAVLLEHSLGDPVRL